MNIDQVESISRDLLAARRAGRGMAMFPGVTPTSLSDAYQIQDHSIRSWADVVSGWKVGGIAPDLAQTLGAGRLVGPIFETDVHHAGAETTTIPIFGSGFAAVEAELVVRMRAAFDPETYGGEWNEHFGEVCLGAEIASSPIRNINQFGPTVVASDFGNNRGLIVGTCVSINELSLSKEPYVISKVNGEKVGELSLEQALDRLHPAFHEFLDIMKLRRIPIPVGTLISTGALTGIHEVAPGDRAQISFGSLGVLSIAFKDHAT